jgi:[acyl-carrier-protein] S-malonyltransferase
LRLAFVFPGQLSLRPGGLGAWHGHPAAHVLDEVARGCGRDVGRLAQDPEVGQRTADAQPAVLAASLVAWRALVDAGVLPSVVAGHGLGEVTAAVAAGVLSVREGAALAAVRGEAMAAACAERAGGMAAVLRLGRDAVEVIVDGIEDAVIANDDAPGRVVVAGPPPALAALRRGVGVAGGRVVALPVPGAFHSPAMAPAAAHLAATLAQLPLHVPQVPVVSGASATPLWTATDVAGSLVAGVDAPVRWREVQSRLVGLGVTHLLEVGGGGALAGLAARAVPQVSVHAVAGPDDVGAVVHRVQPLGVAV